MRFFCQCFSFTLGIIVCFSAASPGESLHGYRMCIQALMQDKPKIATLNLADVSQTLYEPRLSSTGQLTLGRRSCDTHAPLITSDTCCFSITEMIVIVNILNSISR